MIRTDIKNYTLAQELQYDVSYISKWTSGHVIPPEKSKKQILDGISKCLVEMSSEEVRDELKSEYEAHSYEELQVAIMENLEAEYMYVKNLQNNTGVDVPQKITYFPEIPLSQYVPKLRHPALHNVRSLDVIAVMDIMAMSKEYQLQIIGIDSSRQKERFYSNVKYSLVLHIQPDKWDYVGDTIFLLNLLEDSSCVNFDIYAASQASGKAVFVVKDEYAISGMILDKECCVSVTMSEDEEICSVLHKRSMTLCTQDKLLFHRFLMGDMLQAQDYIHTVLAMDQRWIIGHMTEHFVSDNLFEEIVAVLKQDNEIEIHLSELRKIHMMTKKLLEESKVKLMIYKMALYNLVIYGELDFYNYRVKLNPEQQLQYLHYFQNLCENNDNVEVRLISEKMISDYEFSKMQCVFLSDTISYIRLDNTWNNLLYIKRYDIKKMFDKFYEELWNCPENMIVSDKINIMENIRNVIQRIQLFRE